MIIKKYNKELDFEYEENENGQLISPCCKKPMSLWQTQYVDLRWDWDAEKKEYIKSQGEDAEKPKCGICGATLSWDYALLAGY